MALFYADEDFPYQAVEFLRRLGHDVLTTAEAGQAGVGIADENVLAYAIQHGRVVVTHNRKDFIRLHSENPNHTGIVVCSVDYDYAALAERINQALLDPMQDQLVRVNRPN